MSRPAKRQKKMPFLGRSFLSMEDFSREELDYVLEKAGYLKKALENKEVDKYQLAGNRDLIVATLFYENSTRTQTSFTVACLRLGLRVVGFTGTAGTSVQKGESLRHTLDMYEAYNCDGVVLRHPLDGSSRFAADHLGIPVFNAGDGKHEHPTQTILDLFTIKEHIGRLDDFDMAMVGDLKYGRTVHSLALALCKYKNVRLHLFSHQDLGFPANLLAPLKEHGLSIKVWTSMEDMIPNVDILYQTRIQKERMQDLTAYDAAKSMCNFSEDMLSKVRKGFGLMHPLPMNKAAPSVFDGFDKHPMAIYKRQAGNGVPTRMTEVALALGLLGDDYKGEITSPVVVDTEDQSWCKDLPLTEAKEKDNTEMSIRPIRKDGTVCDHLIPYNEDIMCRMLRVKQRKDVYRTGVVRSIRRPDNHKGMFMVEDRSFTASELKHIAVLSPGCRVNSIRAGKVVKKSQLSLPASFEGIGACTNQGCITNAKHLENVASKFFRMGSQSVRCHFCDTISSHQSIF